MIGLNRYYGGKHEGEASNWAILDGQHFTDPSVLFNPRSLPTNLKQVAGHPMIISESSWVPPVSYQSEGPFLVSLFQSLTGVDGFYWFTSSEPQWRQPSSANRFRPSLGKWVIDTPEILGNFPAAALMYRKGYIQQGTPVIQEHRRLDEIWQRRSPLIAEEPTFDPNRDRVFAQPRANSSAPINPLAFLVGPVEVSYAPTTDQGTDQSKITDISPYIDESQQHIRSNTGEIEWAYGQGICTLNAPKVQGVTGFLKAYGQLELNEISIDSQNTYATVIVISMDDEAIATSKKLLVQVGTRTRSTGWEQRAISWPDEDGTTHDGFEILNYGEAPWRVENTDVTLAIQNPNLTTALLLDMNGMIQREIALENNGTQQIVHLPHNAKYMVLQ